MTACRLSWFFLLAAFWAQIWSQGQFSLELCQASVKVCHCIDSQAEVDACCCQHSQSGPSKSSKSAKCTCSLSSDSITNDQILVWHQSELPQILCSRQEHYLLPVNYSISAGVNFSYYQTVLNHPARAPDSPRAPPLAA